jgi:hypothetical protein
MEFYFFFIYWCYSITKLARYRSLGVETLLRVINPGNVPVVPQVRCRHEQILQQHVLCCVSHSVAPNLFAGISSNSGKFINL